MRTLPLESLEDLAEKFRATYGLGGAEPFNAKTILRRLNVLTMYRPLSENLWGLSLKTPDGKELFMLVNSNSTRGRQHFTIAHELFHLLYEERPTPHFCNGNDAKDPSEKNADMFASCLLMPRQGILKNLSEEEIVNKKPLMSSLLKIEQLYGVSHQALVYRMKRLRLISEEGLQRLIKVNIQQSAYEYGVDQSLYKPGNENLVLGDFGVKARELFEEEKISEGHYMELLNLISNDQD